MHLRHLKGRRRPQGIAGPHPHRACYRKNHTAPAAGRSLHLTACWRCPIPPAVECPVTAGNCIWTAPWHIWGGSQHRLPYSRWLPCAFLDHCHHAASLAVFLFFTLLEDLGFLPGHPWAWTPYLKMRRLRRTMCDHGPGLGCNAAEWPAAGPSTVPQEHIIAVLTNSMIPCCGRFSVFIMLIPLFLPLVLWTP